MADLVGRHGERVLLEQALAAAGSTGGVVLVSGEAGVGKTRLIHAVLAEGGWRVLSGNVGPAEATPYAPLVDALRRYLRAVPNGLREAGPLASHLALLLPELGPPPTHSDRPTLVEALRSAFARVAGDGPVAIFLDDLHWADTASLEMLPALARGLEDEPIVFVGAYRSDDLPRGHPLRGVRTELRRDGRLLEIAIEPLDPADTATLAAQVFGAAVSPRLAALVHDRTQGLPFFIEELAAGLADSRRVREGLDGLELTDGDEVPIPESLRDAILLRISDLSDAAHDALAIVAVAGVTIDLDMIEELADTDAGLMELIERGILLEAAPGYASFRHALIREAVYGQVSWPRRRALHRAVAAALETATKSSLAAEHWLVSREFERARLALLAAADASIAMHAYHDAAESRRRALELWPETGNEAERLSALDRLGEHSQLAGDLIGATSAWTEAANGWRAMAAGTRLAVTERRLAAVLELHGQWEQSLAHRQAAAAAFAGAGLPGDAASERFALAIHLQEGGRFHDALELLAVVAEEATSAARPDLMARALGLEGNIRAKLGETETGLVLVRRGLALALEHDLSGPAAEVYQRLAGVLEHAADYRGAREAFREAYLFCEGRNLVGMGQICLACVGVVLWYTGEWNRAVPLYEEIRMEPDSPPSAVAIAGGLLGNVHVARGETKRARPLLLEYLAFGQRYEYANAEFGSTWALARLEALEGDIASAIGRCHAALARWGETEERHYAVPHLRWSATFFAESHRPGDVGVCANALARIAAETGNPEALAALAHSLGEVALADGDAPRAVSHFMRANELLSTIDVPFERAQVQLRMGIALAAAGQREASVTQLVAAYRTAAKLGARPLADRVAREMATLGERVERRLGRRAAAQLERAGLSRRELEVVRLVAVGQTNREIGRELFLSERTVEMHVGNALAKLACRTRTEAAHKAGELGLLTNQAPP